MPVPMLGRKYMREAEIYPPSLNNLITWAYDPVSISGSQSAMTSGTAVYIKMAMSSTQTVTNVILAIETAGATLTVGQNFVGVFDDAGNRLGLSADQSANWTTVGLKTIALTAPVTAQGGYGRWVHVAILCVATTPISPARGSSSGDSGIINAGLASPKFRFGLAPAAQTALPTTTPALTVASNDYWAALS